MKSHTRCFGIKILSLSTVSVDLKISITCFTPFDTLQKENKTHFTYMLN